MIIQLIDEILTKITIALSNAEPVTAMALIVSVCALFSAPLTEIIKGLFKAFFKWLRYRAKARRRRFKLLYKKKFAAYDSFMRAAGYNRFESHNRDYAATSAALLSAMLVCGWRTRGHLQRLQRTPAAAPEFDGIVEKACRSMNRELTWISGFGLLWLWL